MMNIVTRSLFLASVAVVGLGAAPQALAQSYGSFGDNIADPGNIPPILEQANAQDGTTFDTNFPASPPNFGNRYSNGRTAAEILPDLLARDFADIQHNAVGNAFSDKLPVSLAGGILLGNGSSIPGPIGRGLTPLNDTDIATQVDQYIARSGPFGRDSVMLLYPSGNDAALALNTIALTMPAQDQAVQIVLAGAQANAVNTAQSAAKLVNAGAGTVLVSNLPNIGQTPAAMAGGLSGVQLATLFSQTTNTGLTTALSAVDPGAGTVIVADSFTLTNDISANPGKYGFADVTSPCSLVPSCVGAGRDVQDQFLFWDAFFPTARGHEISAAFLADTVNAPRTIPALAEQARYGTESHARSLLSPAGGEGLWIEGSVGYERFRRADTAFAAGYQADGPTANLMLGWSGPAGLTAGVSLGYADMDVDFRSLDAGFDRRSVNLGAFAGIETPFADVSVAFSYGFDQFDNLSRATGVAGQVSQGATEGDSLAVVAEISNDIGLSDVARIGPAVRIGYSRSDVDGFAEAGATGLSQAVQDQRLSKTFAELGATARFSLAGFSAGVSGFYHVRLDGGRQTVGTSLVSLPGFTRTASVRAADRDYGRLEADFAVPLGSNIQLGVQGEMTFADQDFSDLAGNLFVQVAF